ncbi:unnamed protein product [Calicophoron daubneyi]|uniref:Ras-GEF domain-containing protein n=1 Tax=Calicophoron daubneyi TaxID=300641 RepID=A0AAV2TLP0_CALDB
METCSPVNKSEKTDRKLRCTGNVPELVSGLWQKEIDPRKNFVRRSTESEKMYANSTVRVNLGFSDASSLESIFGQMHTGSPSRSNKQSAGIKSGSESRMVKVTRKSFDTLDVASKLLQDRHLKINPELLAQQMTLIELRLFQAIQPEELLSLKWNGKEKQKYAPNIVASTRWFNQIIFWVQKDVLNEEQQPRRTEVLAHFVRVAKKLVDMNNFCSAMAIISGLQVQSIYRLNASWAGLSSRDRTTFRKLADLFTQEQNYVNLRAAFDNARLPCIPYLGLYLSDLTYIDVAASASAHNPNGSWGKQGRQDRMNAVLRTIASFQQSEYPYTRNEKIASYLESQRYIEELQRFIEDSNYKLSLRLEPPSSEGAVLPSDVNSILDSASSQPPNCPISSALLKPIPMHSVGNGSDLSPRNIDRRRGAVISASPSHMSTSRSFCESIVKLCAALPAAAPGRSSHDSGAPTIPAPPKYQHGSKHTCDRSSETSTATSTASRSEGFPGHRRMGSWTGTIISDERRRCAPNSARTRQPSPTHSAHRESASSNHSWSGSPVGSTGQSELITDSPSPCRPTPLRCLLDQREGFTPNVLSSHPNKRKEETTFAVSRDSVDSGLNLLVPNDNPPTQRANGTGQSSLIKIRLREPNTSVSSWGDKGRSNNTGPPTVNETIPRPASCERRIAPDYICEAASVSGSPNQKPNSRSLLEVACIRAAAVNSKPIVRHHHRPKSAVPSKSLDPSTDPNTVERSDNSAPSKQLLDAINSPPSPHRPVSALRTHPPSVNFNQLRYHTLSDSRLSYDLIAADSRTIQSMKTINNEQKNLSYLAKAALAAVQATVADELAQMTTSKTQPSPCEKHRSGSPTVLSPIHLISNGAPALSRTKAFCLDLEFSNGLRVLREGNLLISESSLSAFRRVAGDKPHPLLRNEVFGSCDVLNSPKDLPIPDPDQCLSFTTPADLSAELLPSSPHFSPYFISSTPSPSFSLSQSSLLTFVTDLPPSPFPTPPVKSSTLTNPFKPGEAELFGNFRAANSITKTAVKFPAAGNDVQSSSLALPPSVPVSSARKSKSAKLLPKPKSHFLWFSRLRTQKAKMRWAVLIVSDISAEQSWDFQPNAFLVLFKPQRAGLRPQLSTSMSLLNPASPPCADPQKEDYPSLASQQKSTTYPPEMVLRGLRHLWPPNWNPTGRIYRRTKKDREELTCGRNSEVSQTATSENITFEEQHETPELTSPLSPLLYLFPDCDYEIRTHVEPDR